MRVAALAALALSLAASARAGADRPPRPGRPSAQDPALETALREMEARMAEYEDIESASVQVPAPVIALGLSTKAYRCWKLKLTGERGRQAREVTSQLQGIQRSFAELKARLAREVLSYAADDRSDPLLPKRISAQSESLEAMAQAWRRLLATSIDAGLVRRIEKGFLRANLTISPRLDDDDYTMVYDSSEPDCPPVRSGTP